jgi:hypothetical protein
MKENLSYVGLVCMPVLSLLCSSKGQEYTSIPTGKNRTRTPIFKTFLTKNLLTDRKQWLGYPISFVFEHPLSRHAQSYSR